MKKQTNTFLNNSIQHCLKHLLSKKFIRLKAICEEKNIKRFYTVYIHKNIFKETTVSLFYGRIGSNSQTRHYYFKNQKDITQFLKRMLRKRLHAKNRIGVNYKSHD